MVHKRYMIQEPASQDNRTHLLNAYQGFKHHLQANDSQFISSLELFTEP